MDIVYHGISKEEWVYSELEIFLIYRSIPCQYSLKTLSKAVHVTIFSSGGTHETCNQS